MINTEAKLNSKIFDMGEIEMAATRDGFGEGLLIAAEENSNVVALSADVASSCRCNLLAEKFPERFFQVGISEQNLVGVAAGLAMSGKIPFIAAYAVFSPGRNWEQIRTMICYNDANVKVVGHHTGLLTGYDGATHQALEDIALMRILPNMKVIVPADAIEAQKAALLAAKISGPVYIRLAREKTPVFTTNETPFIPGKAEIFWESKKPQVLIIGCGPILHNALLAADDLGKEKIGTIVLNNHTIKPLDENKIVALAKKCGAVVSVEEHNIFGGLGSAISEVLVKNFPTPMEFIGSRDIFGESGKPEELFKKYGLGVKDIKEAVKRVIKKRSL